MQNRVILPSLLKAKEDPDRKEDRRAEAKDTAAELAATRKPDDPTEDGVDKSYSADDVCVAQLLKGRANAQEILDLLKAGPASIYTTPGALSAKRSGGYQGVKMMNELDKLKAGKPSELDPKKEEKPKPMTPAVKSEGESDLEKAKKGTQTEERAEFATDPEKEKEEHGEKSYSLDFCKSILGKMGLDKSKTRNESGEEFQDGSEDTIGAEGHAAPARAIAHEGGGTGPDHPGTKTKKASQEAGDLEKSDNLSDNKPEEFKDKIEEDDTIPSEGKEAKKSFTYDEINAALLLKSSPFAQEILDSLIKAEGDRGPEAAREYKFGQWHKRAEARGAKMRAGIEATKRAVQHFKNKADLDEEESGAEKATTSDLHKSIDAILEKASSYSRGTQSPTKGAAGRHFAREAREEQKAEDLKPKVPRASVLGSGGDVTKVSEDVIRVRPHKPATVGSEAKITRSSSVDLMKSLDEIIEKARRPAWDPKPKHVEDGDKEAFHAGTLSGDPGSREHEYKRKEELTAKWQAKKNSPEFRAASKIKDADED